MALLAYDRDFVGAEQEFRRAIELNPSNSDAHSGFASYFTVRRQFDQSIAEARKAREVDPFLFVSQRRHRIDLRRRVRGRVGGRRVCGLFDSLWACRYPRHGCPGRRFDDL